MLRVKYRCSCHQHPQEYAHFKQSERTLHLQFSLESMELVMSHWSELSWHPKSNSHASTHYPHPIGPHPLAAGDPKLKVQLKMQGPLTPSKRNPHTQQHSMADPGWFLTQLMQGSFKGYPIVCDKVSHTQKKTTQEVHHFKPRLTVSNSNEQLKHLDPTKEGAEMFKTISASIHPKQPQRNRPVVIPSANMAILRCPSFQPCRPHHWWDPWQRQCSLQLPWTQKKSR